MTDPVDPHRPLGHDDGSSPAAHAAPRDGHRRRGLNVRPINWLLAVPLIGTLVPEFYNYRSPEIGGMPFFYWYQLLWIAISVSCTIIVYRATRGD